MKGNFKIVIMVVFMSLALFGILVFSGLIKIGDQSKAKGGLGTVVLWGTEKSQNVSKALEDFNRANPTFVVKYVQKYPETFDEDLLEALASGTGPDMFFVSNDLVYKYSNKIFTIPYASYPLASFKNTFAGAGEVFLTSKGVLAFPMTIDPLVMYYNRSILDTNNVIYPPATWTELENLVPTLTQKDDSNKIIKSTVALGQFTNINHAKDILSALFMQVGNPIVYEKDGNFISALGASSPNYNLGTILKYYNDYSNPLNNLYSWNKSFPESSNYFSAENSAFYFGYASELRNLIDRNPNQNFLVAAFPQLKNSNFKLTNSKVTGIAIASSSKNFNTAFTAASLLATSNFAKDYAKASSQVPARRDLLAEKQTDAFSPIFYAAALYAKAWMDPSEKDTNDIFRRMIESVNSNNLSPNDAIKDGSAKLDLLLIR